MYIILIFIYQQMNNNTRHTKYSVDSPPNFFYITQIELISLAKMDPICQKQKCIVVEGRKEMFYLTTHSTHFIYGYMASDIW